MVTSSDLPYLDCAYKLQEYAGRARRKRSEGKPTWPGRKQVVRSFDNRGRMKMDRVVLEAESGRGKGLLTRVMRNGKRVGSLPTLEKVREYAQQQLARLPDPMRQLKRTAPYPVEISERIRDLAREVDRRSRLRVRRGRVRARR